MRDIDKPLGGKYVGEPAEGEPDDELEHFMICPTCGQAIDMRDLSAVFHHDDPNHKPVNSQDEFRLLKK